LAPTPPSGTPPSTANWPTERNHLQNVVRLDIVTLTRRNTRQRCDDFQVTDTTVICGSDHHKQTVFQRDDVAALIDPRSHHDRDIMIIPLALLAASLIGSFFVPLAWSITLRVFTGLSFAAFAAMGEGDSGDHSKDILIYQRPGTPLTTALHS